jgi:hypothetical protein
MIEGKEGKSQPCLFHVSRVQTDPVIESNKATQKRQQNLARSATTRSGASKQQQQLGSFQRLQRHLNRDVQLAAARTETGQALCGSKATAPERQQLYLTLPAPDNYTADLHHRFQQSS